VRIRIRVRVRGGTKVRVRGSEGEVGRLGWCQGQDSGIKFCEKSIHRSNNYIPMCIALRMEQSILFIA
jgi:hypothetical protein